MSDGDLHSYGAGSEVESKTPGQGYARGAILGKGKGMFLWRWILQSTNLEIVLARKSHNYVKRRGIISRSTGVLPGSHGRQPSPYPQDAGLYTFALFSVLR
jgi:hypothetical protein